MVRFRVCTSLQLFPKQLCVTSPVPEEFVLVVRHWLHPATVTQASHDVFRQQLLAHDIPDAQLRAPGLQQTPVLHFLPLTSQLHLQKSCGQFLLRVHSDVPQNWLSYPSAVMRTHLLNWQVMVQGIHDTVATKSAPCATVAQAARQISRTLIISQYQFDLFILFEICSTAVIGTALIIGILTLVPIYLMRVNCYYIDIEPATMGNSCPPKLRRASKQITQNMQGRKSKRMTYRHQHDADEDGNQNKIDELTQYNLTRAHKITMYIAET